MLFNLWKIEGFPVGKILEILAEEDLSAVTSGRSRSKGDEHEEKDKYPYLHILRYINSHGKSKRCLQPFSRCRKIPRAVSVLFHFLNWVFRFVPGPDAAGLPISVLVSQPCRPHRTVVAAGTLRESVVKDDDAVLVRS